MFFLFGIFDSDFVFSVSDRDKFNPKTYRTVITPLCGNEDNNKSTLFELNGCITVLLPQDESFHFLMYLLWFNLCFCKCELQKNVMQSNVCNVKYSNPLAVYCFPYQFIYFVTTRFWQVPSYIPDVFNNLKKVFESSACICSSLFEQ